MNYDETNYLDAVESFRWVLKSQSLSNRYKLTDQLGLYLVATPFRVVYVGKAKSIHSRWNGTGNFTHHKLPLAKKALGIRIYALPLSVTYTQLGQIEMSVKNYFQSRKQACWNDIGNVRFGRIYYDWVITFLLAFLVVSSGLILFGQMPVKVVGVLLFFGFCFLIDEAKKL